MLRSLLVILAWVPLQASGAEPTESQLATRLIEALVDDDPDIRQNLSAALVKLGPVATPLLIDVLKSPTAPRQQRAGAAYVLGQIGPAARSAIPVLLDALKDPDRDVRRQASYAVSRLIPNRAIRPADPVDLQAGRTSQ
jgi:HEAT repeat protein